jgi:hypothetical protein
MFIKKPPHPAPQVDLIHNILSLEENIKIIVKLLNSPWYLGKDNHNNNIQEIFNFDRGFTNCVFNEDKNYSIDINQDVAKDAQIIYERIKTKANINSSKLIRLSWNMYFRTSKPKYHTDMDLDGYKSIVYDLHTTDGATVIGGHIFPDKMGQAKIFKSNILHKGVIPKRDNIRFNLNIIFKINK